MGDNSHFFYFGYGSNMNTQRIRLNSPSATFHCIAKLDDYKLTFANNQYGQSKLWHGATATIIRDKGNHLWGAVWILSNENLESLDRQEGVNANIYRPFEVEVMTEDQKLIKCRTYEIVNPQLKYNKPSPQYLNIILTGARQIKLSSEYLHRLHQIEHNGNDKDVDLENKKVETA